MFLWVELFKCVRALRPACSRMRTFEWLLVVIAAMATRPDLLGVSSFIRASWLKESCYELLLKFFHSPALNISKLVALWVKRSLKLFSPVEEQGTRLPGLPRRWTKSA